VNDCYKPYIRPDADETRLLRVARISAVGVSLFGIALVPVFANFRTIYEAHGAFTAAVTPPLVVTLLLSVFWQRFTRTAAIATLAGGMGAIVLSLFVPKVIQPFAHGVPMAETGEGLFAGMRQFQFMRAFYGLAVSGAIAVVVTLLTRPEPVERRRGLVWGTVDDAIRHYKGSPGHERPTRRAAALASLAREDRVHEATGLPLVRISQALARSLEADVGDLLHVSDRRAWLGGLRSTHAIVDAVVADSDEAKIEMGPEIHEIVVSPGRRTKPLAVERLY
jgi:SSS family solute:Na+ symporter